MKLDDCIKFLFLYALDGNQGLVWAFSGGMYHRCAIVDGGYRFIRSQKFLPRGASGMCYGFTRIGYESLNGEAQSHGISLRWHEDVLSCEQGEILEGHPEWIFGLSKPIGISGDEDGIEREGGEEAGEHGG